MVISLVLIFIASLTLSFFEERLNERDKIILYSLIGFAMIFTAGLREPGSTPDSEGYEMMLQGNTNEVLEEATEPTFIFICSIVNSLSCSADELLCDELNNAEQTYSTEISKILEDCTSKELMVMTDTLISLKPQIEAQC